MKTLKVSKFDCFKRPVLIAIIISLIMSVAIPVVAQTNSDKTQVAKKVADRWIKVAVAQYDRGMYKEAEQSFLRAMEYEEYLTDQEIQKISDYLQKTKNASTESVRIESHLQKAEQLIEQDQLIKAKAHLQKVKDSEFLSAENRAVVDSSLEMINSKLDSRKQKIAELYDQSVQLYNLGQYEAAREGFVEVARSGLLVAPKNLTPEDYLLKIDQKLTQTPQQTPQPQIERKSDSSEEVFDELAEELTRAQQQAPQMQPQSPNQAIGTAQPQSPVAQAPDEESFIQSIERKRRIIREYTNAVVTDAISKAQTLIAENDYDEAQNVVEKASNVVNENQYLLGEELYNTYNQQLTNLYDTIEQGKELKQQRMAEQKRQQAVQAQQQYRRQMETERQQRIKELMQNAIAYQQQQRYEEALGQLESLLALDPQNCQALLLKQTISDVISFKRQLEIHQRANEERVELLTDTDETAIPYADEITYPQDWKEISEKRKPDESFGMDPADMAVNEQLDEIVSFPNFSTDLAFTDAIDSIRNSVDPPLKIIVKWRDLYDNADIEPSTPIRMDPIMNVPLKAVLENLLESVSGGFAELGYNISNGVITIGTVENLPSDLKVVVYDISDLVGEAADYFAESDSGTTQAGGGGSGGTYGGGFEDDDQEQDRDRDGEQKGARIGELITLIQETVDPTSWYEAGGEGTIHAYEGKKLSINQKPEVHREIDALLKDLRKSHGHQVAIEARFLIVGENFLEDIGVDVDFVFAPHGRLLGDFGDDNGIRVDQRHSGTTNPSLTTGVPGSLGAIADALAVSAQYGSFPLNDLQVEFMIRATQAHRDSKSLNAPKVTVLSGESAALRLQQQFGYASDIEPDFQSINETDFFYSFSYTDSWVITGSILNITPIITPDKKNVLLNISAELSDFLGFEDYTFTLGNFGGQDGSTTQTVSYPSIERSRVQTRVSVPDGGTLLLGGQKITVEEEIEAGVPVLSKLPLFGRLFSNRSIIKDQRVLLILVKPTIILQEEVEAEAMAALEEQY